MALREQYTLFPGDNYPAQYAPIQTVMADWFNLGANSEHSILDINDFGGQIVDINRIGGMQTNNVDIVIETERNRQQKGIVEDTVRYETETLAGLNDPTQQGPVATNGLSWSVANRGSNTPAPYKTFLNYDIREMTVLDKLRYGIPLQTKREKNLASKNFAGQDFTLREREDLNLPPERDPVFEPNLNDKIVLEEETIARTVDLNTGQQENVVEAAVSVSNRQPQDVIYLTGFGGNWQQATTNEDVTLNIGDGSRKVMEVKTLGMPGSSGAVDNESFPPYYSDVHIPFLNEMNIWLTTSADINNIDVQVEYARVDRTLVEKALYGLRDEINAASDVRAGRAEQVQTEREALYEQIREKLAAGLPINLERRQAAQTEA